MAARAHWFEDEEPADAKTADADADGEDAIADPSQ